MNPNINSYGSNKYIPSNKPHEIAIIPNDSLWKEKLKNYEKSKDIFYYNKTDFPKIITKELIMSTGDKFNPITQKYMDSKKDNLISKSTKNRKINLISNGYDRQLEVESTYNLINLSNKLKYFNYEEPSPKRVPNQNLSKDKMKENQFNYETINKKPYNILSNISLKEHNYLSPKLRPTNTDKLIKNSKDGLYEFDRKNNKINELDRYKRDFNIINNEYKIFNKEKKETEKEIQNLNAVKKMQNRKTYDILNCKYINPTLENEFVKNIENKKKLLLNKTKDKNFIIRNPINNIIYDKEGQKRLDDIEEKKKRRFNVHNNIENYYHSIGNNVETYKNEMSLSHGNPLDLNVKSKRGYDIISGNNYIDKNNQSKNRLNTGDNNIEQKKAGQYYDNWEKIKLKSDANNTVSIKPIYKEPYDYSDVEKNYEKYLQNRKATLISNNIIRSYDTFTKQSGDVLNNRKKSNDYAINTYNTRTNNGSFRRSNSNLMNNSNNRIEYKINYDKMDKNKFFGNSYLIKK